MKSKKKQLEEYKKELEEIYKTTTKAYRQRAGMQRRIVFICDNIVKLENEIERTK